MAFKMGFSCYKEVVNYLNKNAGGSTLTISIEPGENKLLIKFLDKVEEECIITVHRDDNDGKGIAFPTVTKKSRLGDNS